MTSASAVKSSIGKNKQPRKTKDNQLPTTYIVVGLFKRFLGRKRKSDIFFLKN